MEERQYKLIDIIIKGLGFVATALSIYFGLSNFNKQQAAASELEFNRNFWKKQTEVYSSVCKNAGTLVANVGNPATFEKQKSEFLGLYYGEMVLVEDPQVDSAMRELRSYVDIVEPKDPNMVNTLKSKVIALSEACKRSAAIYKRATTE
ncbi:MAG: hypothetical protein JWQ09_3463 [Segetibacter sp.]|nr:hypothetical protein [Segetibacter sp.]